jgi:hypothetical protein
LLILNLVLASFLAWSAVDRVIAVDAKKHRYIEHGTINGGEYGEPATLLQVRKIVSPQDGIERMILDFGDAQAKPLKKRLMHYQVAVDKNKSRVVLDLSQVIASGVSAQQLAAVFKKSNFVKSTNLLFDPIDNSLVMQLDLKKKIKLEAFHLLAQDKASRLVVDLKEIK